MPGLSIVQSLLALIFYKSCPQQLIAMVFSSEFIKRLEQEIEMCYSKNTYPTKVMNQVMQLNRAVCLDCPEVNVKWFQQSFMEAQGSKLPFVNSRVHGDLRNVLLEIVENPELLMINRVTPYGYQVDFEISIDQYNRFVRPLPDDYVNANYNPNLNRIAILLLNNRVLCDNDIHRVKGSELLRMRHLEMMGYRVVHVKSYEFNSLYENVSAKIKYLKNLLQLTA
jgi:FAST kinase-like protein, subdomain 2/RAP domain